MGHQAPYRKRYDEDFFAWSKDQAAILRDLAAGGRSPSPDLDLEHIAEEMESLGSEQLHAVKSAMMRIVQHLLKLEYSPARDPRRHWEVDVDNFRDELSSRLEMNPSLRPRVGELLSDSYPRSRRQAARDLRRDKVDAAILPKDCPYSLDQVREDDWYPLNRFGLE